MVKGIVFGKGFFGTRIAKELGYEQIGYEANPLEIEKLKNYLDLKKPDIVVNAVGKTGRPNIDWCETHKEETMLSNVSAAVSLASECSKRGIYFVHLSSGCIYEGNNNGRGFSEDDEPNFYGSFYSRSKVLAEKSLKEFPGLILRIRMPIDYMPHPRNLIDKLKNYPRVINVQNSISVVPDMIEVIKLLVEKRRQGIYNLVNPGTISVAEIMGMYQETVDENHKFEIFSLGELEKLTNAKRSNCILSIDKLKDESIELPEIHEAVENCLLEYRRRIEK